MCGADARRRIGQLQAWKRITATTLSHVRYFESVNRIANAWRLAIRTSQQRLRTVTSAPILPYSIMPGLAMVGRWSCDQPAERIWAARSVVHHNTCTDSVHEVFDCIQLTRNLRVEHGQYEGTQTILSCASSLTC
jgi:hypothetical protein